MRALQQILVMIGIYCLVMFHRVWYKILLCEPKQLHQKHNGGWYNEKAFCSFIQLYISIIHCSFLHSNDFYRIKRLNINLIQSFLFIYDFFSVFIDNTPGFITHDENEQLIYCVHFQLLRLREHQVKLI